MTPIWYVPSPILPEPTLKIPIQNGGYINPPAPKRQFRDPYGDWWDKQERRNYGEPVHEDNDIMGMFSPDEYMHFKPGKAFFLLGCFVTTVFGLCGVVSIYYPDKPSAQRTFPGGLSTELGGPGALWVSRVNLQATMRGDLNRGRHRKTKIRSLVTYELKRK